MISQKREREILLPEIGTHRMNHMWVSLWSRWACVQAGRAARELMHTYTFPVDFHFIILSTLSTEC